jgi:hypothetical protein
MQFLQPSFDGILACHHIPPGGASPPSRYNPHDAIYAAAFYLCDDGASRSDVHAAIFAYNHADWYGRLCSIRPRSTLARHRTVQ